MRRLIILICIIILLVFVVLLNKLFSIKYIDCTTQYGPCTESQIQPLQKLVNKSVLLPLPIQEIQDLYSASTDIKSVFFNKNFPQTLQIELIIREPVGTISSMISGPAYAVDIEGIVIGLQENSDLPLLIDANFSADLKNTAQSNVLALNSLSKIDQLTTSRVVGSLENTTLTATYLNGPKIIIDIGDNVDRWYFPLQQVLERSKITSKSPSKIDLRFKDPVLTY